MKQFNKIILNVPHSSIEGWNKGWNDPIGLYPYVKDLTDWYTDLLFDDKLCVMVRFPYSRFYCDAERLWNDPMEKIGQGIYYTSYANDLFKRDDSFKDDAYCLWRKHQDKLLAEINGDDCLIVDCHSFPKHIDYDVDICIGFNDDWSKPDDEVINFIRNTFENEGYRVGINKPYSNSITPRSVYDYKSIMIEVNKNMYMHEDMLDIRSVGFNTINSLLHNIYKQLLK